MSRAPTQQEMVMYNSPNLHYKEICIDGPKSVAKTYYKCQIHADVDWSLPPVEGHGHFGLGSVAIILTLIVTFVLSIGFAKLLFIRGGIVSGLFQKAILGIMTTNTVFTVVWRHSDEAAAFKAALPFIYNVIDVITYYPSFLFIASFWV